MFQEEGSGVFCISAHSLLHIFFVALSSLLFRALLARDERDDEEVEWGGEQKQSKCKYAALRGAAETREDAFLTTTARR